MTVVYSELVFVALVIQQAMCLCRVILSPVVCLSVCTTLSTSSHKLHDFRLKIIEHKIWVLILSKTYAWNIFRVLKIIQLDNTIMYVYLHVKWPFFLSHIIKHEYSRQTFERYSNAKFNDNQSSGRQVVLCGHTDRHDEAKIRFSQFC